MVASVPYIIAAIGAASSVKANRQAKAAQAQASEAANRAAASRQRQEEAVKQQTKREEVVGRATEERTEASSEAQRRRIREGARRLGQSPQSSSRLRSEFQKSTGRLGTLDK